MRPRELDVRVAFAGDRRALSVPTVRRLVSDVLQGEGRVADVTVTFMSGSRMRSLNRKTFGRDRSTDVISFGMQHGEHLVADVYVCPSVARRAGRAFGVSAREELVRLVVHGTLHALGYDHPDDSSRTQSQMWRRQERYVSKFLEGSP